jgi:hypothetical protein
VAPDGIEPVPTLSVVLTGRNDGYGGDFLARAITAIRFNHTALTDSGVAYELMLVEWAPLPDRPLLSELIEQAVPAVQPHLTTLLVDAEYQQAFTLNPRLAYLEYLAKNVGIRRTRGRYVLATNADVLLSRPVVAQLAAGMTERGVFRAPRIDLTLGLEQSGMTWEALENPANHWRSRELRPPLYSGGTGDFLLADRDTFHTLRGFNEIYRLVRVGVDYNFLVKAFSCGVPIRLMNGSVYHINHAGSFRITRAQYADRAAAAPWGNQRWHSRYVSYENPDAWGLANAPEMTVAPRRVRLAFDWKAVPPMLDLKRLVIPARHAVALPRRAHEQA